MREALERRDGALDGALDGGFVVSCDVTAVPDDVVFVAVVVVPDPVALVSALVFLDVVCDPSPSLPDWLRVVIGIFAFDSSKQELFKFHADSSLFGS